MTSTVIASNSSMWEQLKFVVFRFLDTVRSANVCSLSLSIVSSAAGDFCVLRSRSNEIQLLSVRFDGVMFIPWNHFNRLFVFAKSKCPLSDNIPSLLVAIDVHAYPHFQLLNLHGRTLVCYVIALLTAYIILAVVQFHSNSKLERCYEAGGVHKLMTFILIFLFRRIPKY